MDKQGDTRMALTEHQTIFLDSVRFRMTPKLSAYIADYLKKEFDITRKGDRRYDLDYAICDAVDGFNKGEPL